MLFVKQNNKAPDQGPTCSANTGDIIGGKFKLEEKLGRGSFGFIFKCKNVESEE